MENEKHGRRRKSVSIPFDLMIEILIRLPAKSLMKFKCLSKEYSSIIQSRHFVDSRFSYSSKKPHLLFAFTNGGELHLYSEGVCASVVMTIPRDCSCIRVPSVHGLICYLSKRRQHVLCNPTTRQLLHLPQNETLKKEKEFDENVLFGYEPILNQFKVLSILTDTRSLDLQFWIFTVGDGKNLWREIQDIPYHYRLDLFSIEFVLASKQCINGVLYYLNRKKSESVGVVSFDLKSEKFGRVELPHGDLSSFKLIEIQGKVALVECTTEIHVWVLEDAEKHKWSSKLFNLPSSLKYPRGFYEYCDAVCACGENEIVFVPKGRGGHTTWYFNIEKQTIREVSVTQNHMLSFLISANHVENLISL